MMMRCWDSLILSLFLFPVVHSFNNISSDQSLDVFLQDLASKSLLHPQPHTDALYKARLPPNLSGMEISFVRIRSKTLWRRGANFNYIHIPMKTLPFPYVRRVFIVYQDFGNWSSSYFHKAKGYSLVSSVVGFMAFDASNVSSNTVTKLDLNSEGNPIEIRFPNSTFAEDSNRRKRCARFGANGTIFLGEMSSENVCYTRNQGYFAVVAPLERKERVWELWVRGFVLGIVGVGVVCFVGIVFFKVASAKRIHEMEREAEESVALETIWIGRSKMPSAAVTRTHPVVENAIFL